MSNETKKNSPKLLLDEHIWAYLAKLLREQGFDVIHVNEVDLDATPDEKIMQYAAGEHRAVVTFNIKHYIPLSIQYFEDGKEHMGLWSRRRFLKANFKGGSRNFLKASLQKN